MNCYQKRDFIYTRLVDFGISKSGAIGLSTIDGVIEFLESPSFNLPELDENTLNPRLGCNGQGEFRKKMQEYFASAGLNLPLPTSRDTFISLYKYCHSRKNSTVKV